MDMYIALVRECAGRQLFNTTSDGPCYQILVANSREDLARHYQLMKGGEKPDLKGNRPMIVMQEGTYNAQQFRSIFEFAPTDFSVGRIYDNGIPGYVTLSPSKDTARQLCEKAAKEGGLETLLKLR